MSRADTNLDVFELFASHTVAKAQETIRFRRKLIEEKKDELRLLVGERYRDVIETSDTIHAMKALSHTILDSIQSLNAAFSTLTVSQKRPKLNRCPNSEILLDIAYFKYLLEVPDLVWNFMDAGDHLSVALLFLLSRSIFARLQLTDSLLSFGVKTNGLTNKIRSSLSHLETAVSVAVRRRLSSVPCTTQEAFNSLGALFLLERLDSDSLLKEYLHCRLVALNQILGGPETVHSNHDQILSLSEWFVSVAKFLCATLKSVEFLFFGRETGASRWMTSVQERLVEFDKTNLSKSALFDGNSYCKDVTRKSPHLESLRNVLETVISNISTDSSDGTSTSSLLESFDSWWSSVVSSCRTAMMRMAAEVSQLNMLVEIRLRCLCLIEKWHSVNFLGQPQISSNTGPQNVDWDNSLSIAADERMASNTDSYPLLLKSADLWNGLFREIFLSRMSELYEQSLDIILKEWTTKILELMKAPAEDLTSVSEVANDVKSAEGSIIPNYLATGHLPESVWSDRFPDVCYGDVSMYTVNRSTDTDAAVSGTESCDHQAFNENLVARLSHALRPDNTGYLVFCLLIGQLISVLNSLPIPADSRLPSPTPPIHLVFFIKRLMSSALGPSHPSSGSCMRPETKLHPSQASPEVYNITSQFNEKFIELVTAVSKNARRDWYPIWTFLLSSTNRLLKNIEKWVLSESYDVSTDEVTGDIITRLPLKLDVASGLCLARACNMFIDLCPSIGAVIIAGTGVVASARQFDQSCDTFDADSSKGPDPRASPFSWSNVPHLRTAWDSSCRPLRLLSARLCLDSLLKATIFTQNLQCFHTSLLNIFDFFTAPTDAQFYSITNLLFENDRLRVDSKSLLPFADVDLNSDNAEQENGCFVTIRVPSSITLPLHRFFLSAVQAISQIVVSSTLDLSLIRELSLNICSALLDVYKQVVDHVLKHRDSESSGNRVFEQETFAHSTRGSSLQDASLQLIFDIHFTLNLLNWSYSSGGTFPLSANAEDKLKDESLRIQKTATELLELLRTLVDPFDWDFCHTRVLSAVSQCLHANSHLYSLLMRPGSANLHLSDESRTTGLDSTQSQYASFIPLISSQNKPSLSVIPISVARCTGRKHQTTNTISSSKRPTQ